MLKMKSLNVNFSNLCYIIKLINDKKENDNLIYICESNPNNMIAHSKNMIKLGR
jgi:hypothetical protein